MAIKRRSAFLRLQVRRPGWRYWAAMAVGAAAILSIWLTLRGPNEEDEAWGHIQQTGRLLVGMDASYPPFEYVGEHGQIIGFDVDLAAEIARRLGVQVEFINMAYDGLYDALLIGQVDVLVSALVAAPEFEGKAHFSTPYFNIGEHLVTRQGAPFQGMEELDGLRLAVEIGSGGDVAARAWERRLPNLTVIRHPDSAAALEAVRQGAADAALVDGVAARLAVGQHPELSIAAVVSDTLLAVATPPQSTVLLSRVNEAIDDMLADGTVDALLERWFGPQKH